MIFGLFKKTKACPIHDENFVKIDWADGFSPKEAEIHAVIEEVDRTDPKREGATLEESLPYATFSQAETLFQLFRERFVDTGQVDAFEIERISIVHREEGKKPSTAGEGFAQPFIIDHDYQNLLKPLVEAMLVDDAFANETYDKKRAYFMDDIYPSYLQSVNGTNELLPIFPSEQDLLEGTAQVYLPTHGSEVNFETQNTLEREQPDTESYSESIPVEDVVSNDQELSEPETFEPPSLLDLMGDSEPFDAEVAPTTIVPSENMAIQKPNYQVEQSSSSLSAQIPFPRFVEKQFSKAHYEPWEDEWLEWRLNQSRVDYNAELANKEAFNNNMATLSLTQQLNEFEQGKIAAIQQVIQEADKRPALKTTILGEIKERQEKELADKSADLTSERDLSLAEEKRRYEAAVEKINVDYKRQLSNATSEIEQRYFNEAQTDYQTAYYEETGRLNNLLSEHLQKLAIEKNAKTTEILRGLHEIGQTVGTAFFEEKNWLLKQEAANLASQYEYAKQVHLVDRQEQLKVDQNDQFNHYMTQMKEQMAILEAQKAESDRQAEALKQQMIEVQSQALNEKQSFLQAIEKTQELGKQQAS